MCQILSHTILWNLWDVILFYRWENRLRDTKDFAQVQATLPENSETGSGTQADWLHTQPPYDVHKIEYCHMLTEICQYINNYWG